MVTGHKFVEFAFADAVKSVQQKMGSRTGYARQEARPDFNDRLCQNKTEFIAERDSFYMASVSETSWTYRQHRGGPKSFFRVLDEKTIGFVNFAGNRQYVSVGNVASNDRVSLSPPVRTFTSMAAGFSISYKPPLPPGPPGGGIARQTAGKSGGGICYGYAVVKRADAGGEPIYGERRINPSEAKIVRRIFAEFAAGTSPRRIAVGLNDDGVPGPLGRAWGDTTIRGHINRGTGIINNELYIGRLIWNRQRYIKDPSTGRRVSRINPISEWITTEVPELRVIGDDLWQAAKMRKAEVAKLFEATISGLRDARAKKMHGARRPAFLLSGLLTCGCCQGRYGIMFEDRYGCLNHFRRGTCGNKRTIRRDVIEQRALSGLTERLVSADAVAEAVRAYHAGLNLSIGAEL